METYLVQYASVPVDWTRIPAATLRHAPWVPPCRVSASAQLCRSEEAFHVRLQAEEPNIRASLTGALDMVCEDSCLEFFFAPIEEDARYFNIEINPLGALYFGFGTGREDRLRLIPPDAAGQLDIRTWRTPGGWGAAFQLPFSLVRLFFPGFQADGNSRANFFKCGEKTATPHYLMWNPTSCPYPDFHRAQDFGCLRSEAAGPRRQGE